MFGALGMQCQPGGILLKVHSLKKEHGQESLFLKEGSSLKPLREGISSTAQTQQTGDQLGIDQEARNRAIVGNLGEIIIKLINE